MVSLNVLIEEKQHENLKKLATFKKQSIGATVREILDEALGSVDAAAIILKHPNGEEEQL